MAVHDSNSQTGMVLSHLQSGKEINPLESLNKYGCYRLGAVIYNLKKECYKIHTRIHRFKKPSGRDGHYAVYKMVTKDELVNG